MSWYAAHVVLYHEFREGPQEEFSVMENVYLIHAATDEEAFARAEKRGRSDCVEDDESLTVDGRPSRLVFGGVRKLISCATDTETLEDGVEATYSFLVVSGRQQLDSLIKGEPVPVLYEE
ncbi:DUF4288 domain-containing protein [Archangium violaceum]|uniref:DUF4288 domain-containing protein n=1 Tax=Archangium violaceum Cb vi76 TaxID=1406225 RepID=A0A084SVM3_9BACT|nr:DUF4288 domain-containing protein [Archangium violaceum]KFA92508.1 hypothetical protein Q664_15005 [Archangium violaceum Cb vi76]